MAGKLIVIKDTLRPDLMRKLREVKNAKPFLAAMGQAVKAIAIASFQEAELRPSAWAPRKVEPKDGHPLLLGSSMPKGRSSPPKLWRAIKQTSLTDKQVTIGSDKPYTATHQLGDPRRNIPARPFLPFFPTGKLTKAGAVRVERALKAALKARGL